MFTHVLDFCNHFLVVFSLFCQQSTIFLRFQRWKSTIPKLPLISLLNFFSLNLNIFQMHPLESFLHVLCFINGFLHGFEKFLLHIKVHISNEIFNNVLWFLNLCKIIFKLDIFHHISLLKDRIGWFHDIFEMFFHILQLSDS